VQYVQFIRTCSLNADSCPLYFYLVFIALEKWERKKIQAKRIQVISNVFYVAHYPRNSLLPALALLREIRELGKRRHGEISNACGDLSGHAFSFRARKEESWDEGGILESRNEYSIISFFIRERIWESS